MHSIPDLIHSRYMVCHLSSLIQQTQNIIIRYLLITYRKRCEKCRKSNKIICFAINSLHCIGAGTGATGEQFLPQPNYWGVSSTSCTLNSSCNLQLKLKSNLTDCKCKVTFNTKILENSPASGTPLYTACTCFEKYILHKEVIL